MKVRHYPFRYRQKQRSTTHFGSLDTTHFGSVRVSQVMRTLPFSVAVKAIFHEFDATLFGSPSRFCHIIGVF